MCPVLTTEEVPGPPKCGLVVPPREGARARAPQVRPSEGDRAPQLWLTEGAMAPHLRTSEGDMAPQ